MLLPISSQKFINISLRLSMKFCQKLSVILEAKQLCKMNLVVLTLKSSRTQKGLSSNLQSIIFFQRTLKGYECMSLFGSPPFMKDFWDTPQPASVNMAHLLPWKRSLILNHRMSLVLSPPVRSSLGNSPSMVLDRCEAPLLASWYFASCCVFFKRALRWHCANHFFKSKFFNNWDALRRGCFFKPLELFLPGPMMSKGAFLSGTKLLLISSRRLAASGEHGAMLQENSQSLGRGFLHLHQMPCGTCCGIFMMQGLAWFIHPGKLRYWRGWEWEKNYYSFKKLLGLTSLFPRRSWLS